MRTDAFGHGDRHFINNSESSAEKDEKCFYLSERFFSPKIRRKNLHFFLFFSIFAIAFRSCCFLLLKAKLLDAFLATDAVWFFHVRYKRFLRPLQLLAASACLPVYPMLSPCLRHAFPLFEPCFPLACVISLPCARRYNQSIERNLLCCDGYRKNIVLFLYYLRFRKKSVSYMNALK